MQKQVNDRLEKLQKQLEKQEKKQVKPQIISDVLVPPGVGLITRAKPDSQLTNNENTNAKNSGQIKEKDKSDLRNKIKEELKIDLINRQRNSKYDYRLSPKVKYELFYEFFDIRTQN